MKAHINLINYSNEQLLKVLARLEIEIIEARSQADIVFTDQKDSKLEDTKTSLIVYVTNNISEFIFTDSYAGVIDANLLDDEAVLQIRLERILLKSSSILINDQYPKLFGQVAKKRIINHLKLGYYVDHIVCNFFEHGFEPIHLRSFTDRIIYFLSYLKQVDIASVPFEIEYAVGSNLAGINIVAPVKSFKLDYLYNSLNREIVENNPISDLLYIASKSCQHLEISYLEQAQLLVINGLWQKDNYQFAQSVIINQPDRYEKIKQSGINPQNSNQLSLVNQQLIDELEEKPLSGGLRISSLSDEENLDYLKRSLKEKFEPETEAAEIEAASSILSEIVKERSNKIISGEKVQEERLFIVQALKDKLRNVDQKKLENYVDETLDQMKLKLKDQSAINDKSNDYNMFKDGLKHKDEEILKLKNKISSLYSDLKATQSALETKTKIDSEITHDEEEIDLSEEINKRDNLLASLRAGELSEEKKAQLESLISNHTVLQEEKKKADQLNRKLEIESRQKESLFLQQIQAKERIIKGKDTVIEKMKESITRISTNKDKKIMDINDRYQDLNTQFSQFKRDADVKIKAASNSIEFDDLKTELRKVSAQASELENKLLAKEKESEKLTTLVNDLKLGLSKISKERDDLFENNKELKQEIKEDKASKDSIQSKNSSVELDIKTKAELIEKDRMIKALEAKLNQMEEALKKTVAKQSDGMSPQEIKQMQLKLGKMEKDREKLMDEMRKQAKASQDTVLELKRLKAENMAWQNKFKALERELIKYKNLADNDKKKGAA